MRVACYVHPLRTVGSVTGVGKHVGHLPPALHRLGVDVQLLAARDGLDAAGGLPAGSPLCGLPVTRVPWPQRALEWCGALAGVPVADTWTGGADWVYCPADSYVAVRKPRLAVTAHTGDWLESDLPWSSEYRYRRLRTRWRLFFRAVRRSGAVVLAVSEFLRGRLVEVVGLPGKQVFVVGNGVEDAFYSQFSGVTAGPGLFLQPYVLMVGGLTVYKGGDRLLRLARQQPAIRFVIAGPNDPALAAQAAVLPNVSCLGYVGADSMPGLMANAAAVLMLSRYETFGIPAAEAMAAGVPVIASTAGALPETMGTTGLSVDADRPAAVAEALRTVLSDSTARLELIHAGQARAAAFRWDRVAERVRDALESAA